MTNKIKFEIHSEDLQVALSLVEPFIQSRKSSFDSLSILDTVLLEGFCSNNTIEITASDLESTCRTFISVKEVAEDFAVAVPGKNLAKLQRLFDGLVKFTFDPDKGKLQARFGKSTTTFKILNAEGFRKPSSEISGNPIMTFDRREMKQVLEEVLAPAKQADDIRPGLQNVFFEIKIDDNRVNIFSTDGILLSLNTYFPISLMKSEDAATFSLHRNNVRKLIDALGRIQAKIIKFHFTNKGNMLLFFAPHETMIYFLTDPGATKQLPPYEKVMIKGHATHITLPIDEVRTFLKRALLLEADIMTISHKTDNSFVRFFAETQERGRTEDSYYAQILGDREFEILVNPKRFSDLLKEFTRGNNLFIKLGKDASSSIKLEMKENPATRMVLMPMAHNK